MEIKNFFDFGSQLRSSTVQAHAVGLKNDENGLGDRWNLAKGNYKDIDFPVIFVQEYGNKLKDILDTGCVALILISDKMKNILEENSLTGWQTYPIKLYDKNNKEISGYHGFSITGRCGPTIYDNCEIIEKRRVPNGPIIKFYKGVFIDRWDGSDFFAPEKTYYTFITKKTADILKKNKITNLKLVNLAEKETEVSIIKR